MAEQSTAAEAAATAADRYVIDARSSRFTVRAFATGLLSAMGHNPTVAIRDFSGEVNFNPEKVEASSFRLAIKTSSLSVQDDISDKDRREMERLMNQEVLETAKFPEIVYEAADIAVTKASDTLFSATLQGRLTLHGVTRSLPVAVHVALWGSMLRASGDFAVNLSNFSIKPVSVAGGSLKLKDEIKCSFEIVARGQE
jgi:polyisoprenoid-binding protein YceI